MKLNIYFPGVYNRKKGVKRLLYTIQYVHVRYYYKLQFSTFSLNLLRALDQCPEFDQFIFMCGRRPCHFRAKRDYCLGEGEETIPSPVCARKVRPMRIVSSGVGNAYLRKMSTFCVEKTIAAVSDIISPIIHCATSRRSINFFAMPSRFV